MQTDQLPIIGVLPEDVRIAIVRFALAILALFMIWVFRRAFTIMLLRPLRALARRTKSEIDDLVLEALVTPMTYVVIAVGVMVSAQILSVDVSVSVFVQRLSRSLIIFAIFLMIYNLVDIFAPSSNRLFSITGLTIEGRLLPFVRTAVKLVVMAVALVIIVQEWGYDVSGLIAGLGLFGLAFSLAAKDTAENLFGFTAIVGDSPFVIGDYIKSGDIEGTVEMVGIRSTRIRQRDQALVTVPNSRLAQSAILNWSRLSRRWVDFTLVIKRGATRSQMMALLENLRAMLKERAYVEKDTVLVRFINFGPAGFEVMVRCYIRLPNWSAFSEEREAINLEIMRIVEEAGVEL